MDNYWIDICSLQNSDSFNISLTVQRELVDLKLEVCTFFTDMLETHLFEVKDINERNLNKNNMIKVNKKNPIFNIKELKCNKIN